MKTLSFVLLFAGVAQAQGIARSTRQPLRDAYTHVRVAVDGDVARTTVTQVFANDLDSPVEASYRFPLPADAAVTGFAEWHDGRRAEAIAADKDAAAKAYERAAAAGERAGLTESDGEGRFQMKLATIPARGTRRIELRYTQTLQALGGERSYVFPAAHGDSPAPTVMDLEVRLVGTHKLLSASSLNHPDAHIAADGDARTVRLTRLHEGLERDLALRWQEESRPLDLAARAVRAKAGEPAYVEARLAFNQDPTPLERAPLDVVLVADTSLSMAGEPLERARALAAGVVAGLSPRDRVALITFSDAVESHHEKDAVAKAIVGMHAHGRSNLEAALDEAATRLRGSANGLLVLMTDGQPTVGDNFDKPASTRADFAHVRVVIAHFNYPSRRRALESLLGAGARYVPDGPAGEAAVGELTRLAIAPQLEEVKLTLEGAHDLEGTIPTPLAAGEALRVMARADGELTVRLTAMLHGRPIALEQKLALPAAPDAAGDRGLPVEWARLRIRGLESQLDDHPEKTDALRDQIRTLGKQYALATRFTSFVVGDSLTPDRIKPGDPELRIHAPREALGVRAVLPWGETVECAWDDDSQLWLGRFLVPRGTADGIYRVQVFVDGQTGTALRTTLLFRVDSKPPRFTLTATLRSGRVHLEARPVADVFDARRDAIVRDLIDLKRIVVQADAREIPLERTGEERWTADLELPSGTHALTLHATDFALNVAQASATVVGALTLFALALAALRCFVPEGPAVASVEWRGATVLARAGALEVGLTSFGTSSASVRFAHRASRGPRVGGRVLTPCDGLPDAHPTALAVVGGASGELVVGFRSGAYALDGDRFRPIGPREPVRALAARGGTLYIGTTGGLWRMDGERAARVKHAVLGRHEITALRFAPDGALHAGAGTAGWWRLAARTTRVSAIYAGCFVEKHGKLVARAPGPRCELDAPPASGLPSGHVTALARHDGALFVGTFDRGLARSDGAGFRVIEDAPRMVNALLSDGATLWIASPRGLWRLDGEKLEKVALGLDEEHVSGLARAPDGTLWLATTHGLAALSDGGVRFVDARLTYAVAVAADGAVWAGTAHGALRFGPGGAQSFLHEWVTALLPDGDGMLAGTYDAGVVRIDAAGTVTRLPGLERAWVNPNGLARAGDALAVTTLGDGLLLARSTVEKAALPIDDVTALVAGGASMWVGTRGGLFALEGRNRASAP